MTSVFYLSRIWKKSRHGLEHSQEVSHVKVGRIETAAFFADELVKGAMQAGIKGEWEHRFN
jgi:hypothetical protein